MSPERSSIGVCVSFAFLISIGSRNVSTSHLSLEYSLACCKCGCTQMLPTPSAEVPVLRFTYMVMTGPTLRTVCFDSEEKNNS